MAPGGEQLVPVRIRNHNNVVDQLNVSVVGPVASWAVVEPSVVRLFPDAEETVQVRFRPPAEGAGPVAGSHVYGIQVRSQEDPAGSTVEERTVVVAPKVAVGAELRPKRSSGRRAGRHRLVIENKGNAPAVISLDGQDPDDILTVKTTPDLVKLQPGEGYVVRVRPVIAGRRPPNGTPIPFAVYYLADGRPAGMVDGAFVPRGLSLKPILALALPLLVIGVLIAALAGRGGAPQSDAQALAEEIALRPVAAVSNLPEDEATERLEGQGFGVRVTRTKGDAEAGTVVGQNPPAGTQLEEGTQVEIVVSLGQEGDAGAAEAGGGEEAGATEAAGEEPSPGEAGGEESAGDEAEGDAPATDAPATGSGRPAPTTTTTAVSKVQVPVVTNRSSAEASFMLGQRGFPVKVVEQASKTVAKSLVISTSPAGGSTVARGSTMVVTISSGRGAGVGATTDLVASRDNVTCTQQGSTVAISYFVLNTGAVVSKSVTRTLTASNGSGQDASAVPSSRTPSSLQFTAGTSDFGKPVVTTIVVDLANGISETDENNNVLAIEVTPSATAPKVAVKVSCKVL